jgi:arylsulfatase A-like enzyme
MKSFLLKFSVFFLIAQASCGGADSGNDPSKTVRKDTGKAHLGDTDKSDTESAFDIEVGADARAYFGDLGIPEVDPARALIKENIAPQSVILIVIDTLNAAHLSAYGYRRNTGPRIKALAREGVIFGNYISNSSWTRPSYTTIITGLPKSGHRVELDSGGLPADVKTLAERFRAAGYRTASFVGNPLMREIWGFGRGFQLYKDTSDYGKGFPFDGLLTDDALSWLDALGDQKHFTVLFFTAPHSPYRPPRKRRNFLSTVKPGPILEYPFREYKKPLNKDVHARIVAAYDDETAYADYQVGRILDYLEKSGKKKNTVVAVTADHGEMLGKHNCYGHAYHMWEGTLRVPLLIRSSNLSVSNRLDVSPHTHIDLAPSLLESAGVKNQSEGLPGKSLFKSTGVKGGRIIMSQYNAHGIRRQAFRDGRYKIIHYHRVEESSFKNLNSLHAAIPHADPSDLPSLVASLKGERYELYDMIADPEEKHDRFEELKDDKEVRALLERVLSYLKEKTKGGGKMSEELIEALKNAGYFVPDED